MFPIIPQYAISKVAIGECDTGCIPVFQPIPKPEIITSTTTSKPRVTITSIIEKNSESSSIKTSDIIREGKMRDPSEVKIYSTDNLIKCNSEDWSWLKHIPLAEDCHSYNIELLQNLPETTLRIKAVRTILPGEKLVLWFSHELILLLQIPHLSLNNIQGEKQYSCHRCPFQCEMPNPLKIHLALECGKLTKPYLWRRLQSLENRTLSPTTAAVQVSKSTGATNFSFGTNVTQQKRNSAFKPYKTVSRADSDKANPKPQNEDVQISYADTPNVLLDDENISRLNSTSYLYKQAVEMETIVSNLGRFKQGHLCIYCGKVYSRKYGLKIHIRTHTGFKPLKCKYCYRPFGDPSNLNKHVRLHSEGDTPYKCEQCGKILVRKRDLDRHMKSRHELSE